MAFGPRGGPQWTCGGQVTLLRYVHIQLLRLWYWMVHDAVLVPIDIEKMDHGQPVDIGRERFYLDRSGEEPRLVRWDEWEESGT